MSRRFWQVLSLLMVFTLVVSYSLPGNAASTFSPTNPSFPLTEKLTYAAFTPPELVHEEKPEITSGEEETTGIDAPSPLDQDLQPMS